MRVGLSPNPLPAEESARISLTEETIRAARVRTAVEQHYDFLWRSLRRLGVAPPHVDDAAQHVLIVFAQRLADIEPQAERGFLFGTAVRVAADYRKGRRRSFEVCDPEALDRLASPDPSVECRIDQRRARDLLDSLLAELPDDLRSVFILFEFEELTMAAIADLLGLRPGTVASRLRRAREAIEAAAARVARGQGRRA
jgi:RNA polymerase sigma-70 factor (ECF subfamily)